MSAFFLPNRLFIKLLLGFWLCSSLIILAVGSLPLLQQNHEAGDIPPPIMNLLQRSVEKLQRAPERLHNRQALFEPPRPLEELSRQDAATATKFPRLDPPRRRRNLAEQPFHLFVFDAQGQLINSPKLPPAVRNNLLMIAALERNNPRAFSFRDEMFFGPVPFSANGNDYRLYGGLPGPHRLPWFFFFIEHKLLTLSLAILLSGVLCALLAWHLGKPLKSLKLSANALAHGDLTNRVDDATSKRHDEIGELGIAFNSMADAIERMVNSQRRLISDISHELRTPLTRLQLALALARKKGVAGEETERIAYEADQLGQMITELLELSRVTLKTPEEQVTVGLAESLSQVLDDAEFEAAQRGKNINIQIPEELLVPHYPRPLSRAIENLLRNAIRYAATAITLSAHVENREVVIIIADDGPGIDEQELQAIFKPFYRPQSARDRETGGWGLGLAITEAAVTAHHGTINARNRPSGGLEVTMRLPLTSQA
ncbi:ATP-binding protein [Shewanella dokdonensis]|uniref:ATP-binding protein n=1 Tax=Shewanella dokdonensis TaxID=712036 RepID=UPI00200F3026|nr:ATP-binding protein [Shewanella dokdonensis]MCL1075710.1 ATP-binding protein [Shewanella dokdonensis]